MRFEFATASRIVFGPGVLKEAAPLAAHQGRRVLVVTGSSPERAAPLFALLSGQGMATVAFSVRGEPSTTLVCDGATLALNERCDCVVGCGGGSVLDAGKAIAALMTNGCDPYKYLEVIGQGEKLAEPPAPYIAIPTTAGTGAEVTANAVLFAPQQRIKVSLRSPLMLPKAAIIDPELTYSLPADVTATTGLDALTQVLEPYVSNKANPLTDAFCREGLQRAARSLQRACARGDDPTAREDMALASLLGGLALANAKLGAVHGFAGLIGGMFPAPHGAVCACLLPVVMDINVRALRAREPGSATLKRYDDVAALLTGRDGAVAEDGVRWVEALVHQLNVPSLAAHGVTEADFAQLVAQVPKTSSMKGNPLELTADELAEILTRAL